MIILAPAASNFFGIENHHSFVILYDAPWCTPDLPIIRLGQNNLSAAFMLLHTCNAQRSAIVPRCFEARWEKFGAACLRNIS